MKKQYKLIQEFLTKYNKDIREALERESQEDRDGLIEYYVWDFINDRDGKQFFKLNMENINIYLQIAEELNKYHYMSEITPKKFDEMMLLYHMLEDFTQLSKLDIQGRYKYINDKYGINLSDKK